MRKDHFGAIFELGMKSGTLKTTIGNPDTYFSVQAGKYIFVAYTTQEKNIDKKIKEDIEKCLDETKTGIEVKDIEEIICCHTSSTLPAGADQVLHQLCGESNVSLQLYGVDRIANEIYFKYKYLAKDFLGIAIDTNQIFEERDFVINYNANEMAAPLDMKFMFRSAEINQILNAFGSNKVVAIYGKAGTGKTRLALEAAKRLSQDNNYRLFCIKSNNLSIAEDLSGYIENPGKYVIFVDDANELTGLKYVLEYINKTYQGYDVKIIVTFRDYAHKGVMSDIAEYTVPFKLELSRFSDDEIKQFLDENMEIRNENYIYQIIRIAEGNPRIAYMAGKLAKEHQSLSAIKDATQLYDNYYNKYINNTIIATDRKMCFSAGILALLNMIRLDKLENLADLLKSIGMTEIEFRENLEELFTMELIEIKFDKVAKFSDQCLSNYMIYYAFLSNKYIPFSRVLDTGFKFFRSGITKSIDTLFSIFNAKEVHDYINQEIRYLWDQYEQNDERIFEEYVKVFHYFRPEESLIYVKNKIDSMNQSKLDLGSIDFSKSSFSDTNIVLNLLTGYRYNDLLTTAMELFIYYVNKDEKAIVQAYQWMKMHYSINKNSYKYGYYTERKVSQVLSNHIEDSEAVTMLYIEIAGHLLSLHFEPVEAGRGNTINFYRIPVLSNEYSQEYRGYLWNGLKHLASDKNNHKHILTMIDKYGQVFSDDLDENIMRFDKRFLTGIIESLYSISPVRKGVTCLSMLRLWKRKNIDYGNAFAKVFDSYSYRMYSLLREEFWTENLTYEESRSLRKSKIDEYAKTITYSQINDFIRTINTIIREDIDSQSKFSINNGLEIFFEAYCYNIENTTNLIQSYINYGGDLDVSPYVPIRKLIELAGSNTTYKLIESNEFSQKNQWQFVFFDVLPENEVNSLTYQNMMGFWN